MNFIVAQIAGAIALLLSVIGLQQNTGKRFLFFQILINLVYTLQYFFLGATVGLFICIINTIRCVVFYYYKKTQRKNSVIVLLVFITTYLITGVCTAGSFYDIILIAGTLMFTYSLWQSRMKITRAGSLISILTYIIYNITVKAYSALLLDFMDLISISIAIVRYDFLKKG
ncbi:MAG: YgjV family protein [Clostridiales bacterium]|jgi:hypothetical protein|nr:YgjV family protein [Clostridiales bacterium]